MIAFINQYRNQYGVESLGAVLPIAPSTYYRHRARDLNPDLLPNRLKQDQQLCLNIKRIWHDNFCVYGVRKVWYQMKREGIDVARCTIARLMKQLGLTGVVRGKQVKTTITSSLPCPMDQVNRQFYAAKPNALWVSDFTYVSLRQGFVYVAFITDVYARYIVGWNVSKTMQTAFVLEALEQALYDRRPEKNRSLIHHSDRGVQYVSVRYTDRLADAGLESSVGSVGDAYDNALAETINGLYKAEVIHREQQWETLEQVELATLNWVYWFNNQRLLSSIDYNTPAQIENEYYQQLTESAMQADSN